MIIVLLTMKAPLAQIEIDRLNKYVVKHGGVGTAAKKIGCNKGTVTAALAGLPVLQMTASLIVSKLDEDATLPKRKK